MGLLGLFVTIKLSVVPLRYAPGAPAAPNVPYARSLAFRPDLRDVCDGDWKDLRQHPHHHDGDGGQARKPSDRLDDDGVQMCQPVPQPPYGDGACVLRRTVKLRAR